MDRFWFLRGGMEESSNEMSDADLLRRLGYAREIDESVGRLRELALLGSSRLLTIARKIPYYFGNGLEDLNQISTWG